MRSPPISSVLEDRNDSIKKGRKSRPQHIRGKCLKGEVREDKVNGLHRKGGRRKVAGGEVSAANLVSSTCFPRPSPLSIYLSLLFPYLSILPDAAPWLKRARNATLRLEGRRDKTATAVPSLRTPR